METRDFFVQKTIKLKELGDGVGFVYSDTLVDLIKNEEVKEHVIAKYELEEEFKIEFDKIDLLIPMVKNYVDRFNLMRVTASDDNVTTFFSNNVDNDVLFKITEGNQDGVEIDEIEAIAIYDSIDMFYEGRKLSQYVNFLKKSARDPNLLLAINESWKNHYEKSDDTLKSRVYRLLYDDRNDIYYAKGINSASYKEYGIAETFVLTVLELYRLQKLNGENFHISSMALSESKIEIILRTSNTTEIEGLGYVYPSITVRNEDRGNKSIGFYSSLEFKLANADKDGVLHFFPNKKVKDITIQKTYDHRVTVQTFVDSHRDIESFFQDVAHFKDDFFFLKKSSNPDQLRAKIEEKIVGARSPFRGITELSDLFAREKSGHIDNLGTLLKLCGRADMVEMNHDLKFQLRYLISNVLLYGENT